jgi:pimeloyl-ACP methyl ester carboxylesterase
VIKRHYIDGTMGQVHLLEAPAPESSHPALLCLHATAYSSESMRPLVAAFGGDRRVIALDTPGYGGSDGPDAPVGIEIYADALAHSAYQLSPSRPVDVFAYHTGVSIAVEAALRHQGRIGRIVAIGIPLFDGPDRDEWEKRLVVRHTLGEGLDQFTERWDYLVTRRPDGLSLARGFGNFVDELRAWPRGWWAHLALFDHDLGERLSRLECPLLVINPISTLSNISRAAAARVPNAATIERPDMSGAIFERDVDKIVEMIRAFLDGTEAVKASGNGKRFGAEISEAWPARADHAHASPCPDGIRSGAQDGAATDHR